MIYSHWRACQSFHARGQRRRLLAGILLYCCLLMLLSGCISVFSGADGITARSTPVIIPPTPAPTPRPLTTDSEIAQALVQSMSLDQKLGQMVISEFYGATLNSDLTQMVKKYAISGVLIENKNGNAQT